jgi:hypothetical protein
MTARTVLAALVVTLSPAVPAMAADVVPKPGAILTGVIKFPRAQQMRIETDPANGSKFLVRMGFDGKCKGGGIQEAWVSLLKAKPTVRVSAGRFSATVKATERDFGEVEGRTAQFTWKLSGRFTAEDAVRATVGGTAVIRDRRHKVISRCEIAKPARVRLSVG